ncbi:MAG: phage tail protein [Planctomycetes bacterium]|nr:phage tail protein [Planctomycetota bacterium]
MRKLLCSALAAGIILLTLGFLPGLAQDPRSYVSGNFFFTLDGVKCGFLKQVDGGGISAEVIKEAAGPTYFVKKHIGTPKYEDFTMQIGFSMSKAVYDWIAASWQLNYQRKNGSIVACDYKLDAKSQREFFNALITETGIPACDGSSKEPAYLTLKFKPEYTRTRPADGSFADFNNKDGQKKWIASNFRLSIPDIDCTKVMKIDAFTVKQTAVTDDIGDARDYLKEPGKLEFPNLKFTLSSVAAQTWYDWHEDFVIKGNNDETKEKNGTLEFLSPNGQDVLARIYFFNLGIFYVGPDRKKPSCDCDCCKNDAAKAKDDVKSFTAELYCERMQFQYVLPNE